MHIILCDNIDSGKSSFCMALVRRLVGSGIDASGWVTPAFIEDGTKRGHDFVAIENNRIEEPIPFTRMHPFASSVSFPDLSGDSPQATAFKSCPYHFNAKAFERANRIALEAAPSKGAQSLFIMDEIGPLELFARGGFYRAASAAFEKAPNALVVVRKGLEEELCRAFPLIAFTVLGLADRAGVESALALSPPDL